jgi:putative intracellular protease/amidase
MKAFLFASIALLAWPGCASVGTSDGKDSNQATAAEEQDPMRLNIKNQYRKVSGSERRIAMVLTNHGELGATGRTTGFFLSEATHPYKVFIEAGYEVDFLSPKGGLAPMDGVDLNDPINAAFLGNGELVERTRTTRAIPDVDHGHYDAVFFSGGHGTMWDLPDDPGVQALIRNVYERGGVVAAVCHGPAALVNARLSDGSLLVAGREVSAFTDEEEVAVSLHEVVPFALESRLRSLGARFVEAPNFEKKVAVSDRLVTGQNPASATGVAEAVVELLERR